MTFWDGQIIQFNQALLAGERAALRIQICSWLWHAGLCH